MDAPALPFEIRASSNRGGTVRFTATRDGAAKAVVTYRVGNEKRRMETATVWAENAALQNGRALTVEAVAAALLAKELEVADALHEADEAPEVERTVDERNADFPAEVKVAEGQKTQRGPSIADQLVELTDGLDLFHTPGADGDAYARVSVTRNDQSSLARTLAALDAKFNPDRVPAEPIAGPTHIETWPVNSKPFRRWLSRRYHEETERAPNNEAMQSALNVIAGKALYDGTEHAVHVRVAGRDGRIYLDLCDADWRVVEVTRGGWRVLPGDEAPVRFIRRKGMLPLPEPVPGGSIDELRSLVNIPDDDQWCLYVAWIVAALRPTTAYPVLSVCGEQGSAKSTACRLARALVDPSEAPLTRPPKNERDVYISVRNSHVVAFNNLSYLPAELSDCLCTVADGSGYRARMLYSDDDETIFKGSHPIALNGIVNVASKSDLADRSLFLTLPCIPDTNRRTDDEINEAFDAMHPRLFGALCDVLATALKNAPHVRLTSKPRMAGFAHWIAAAEPTLGWPSGTFMAAYTANRADTHVVTVESDAVGDAVYRLMEEHGDWEGTSSELLAVLNGMVDDKTRERDWWPKKPEALGRRIRKIAPNLRGLGIGVDTETREHGRRRRRLIRLTASAEPSATPEPSANCPQKNSIGAIKNRDADSWTVSDGSEPLLSGPGGMAIDALYSGALTGTVPEGWTRDGWVISLKDRLTRTDDPEMRKTIQAELDAVMGKTKDGDTNSEA